MADCFRAPSYGFPAIAVGESPREVTFGSSSP
jgi:hypothetical protein